MMQHDMAQLVPETPKPQIVAAKMPKEQTPTSSNTNPRIEVTEDKN